MKRLLLALFLVASLTGGAFAFEGSGAYVETLTFAASPASTGISASKYLIGRTQAKGAMISVETQSIRATFNGTDASASVGHLFTAGSFFTIDGYQNVKNFRCISITDNTAVVQVTTFF